MNAVPEEQPEILDPNIGNLAQLREALGFGDDKVERKPIQWPDLEGKEPPIRPWKIQYWLAPGVTLLAGPGAAGKSLLSQMLGTSLALGKRFIDDVVAPQNVLYWACEDDHDELWRRQIPISRHFQSKLSDLQGKFIIEPRVGRENTLFQMVLGTPQWTPLLAELRDQVNDYQADVLILDNVGQVYGGQENDRHHVTAFVNGLVGLALERQLAVLLLAHPAKAAGSEFSGSTAWENAVRMRWYLGHHLPDEKPTKDDEEEEAQNVRYLSKRKANYSQKDFRKFEIVEGIFRTDHGVGEFTQRYGLGNRQEDAETCVLHALERFAEASIRVTDGHTSPDFLPRKMVQMKLASDYSAKELRAAMDRLRLAGRIVEIQVGVLANRMPKMGLRRAP